MPFVHWKDQSSLRKCGIIIDMSRLSLWYPAKPFIVRQGWGIYNPAYLRFKFSKHNGVDFLPGEDNVLRAAVAGKVIRVDNFPTGGGIFVSTITDLEYDEWDAPLSQTKSRVILDYLHCEKILVQEGQHVNVGDIIAIPDNTGFSTGPHTHMQGRRAIGWNGQVGNNLFWENVDKNEANNSFDPTPYWNGYYAKDVKKIVGIWAQLIEIYKKMITKL